MANPFPTRFPVKAIRRRWKRKWRLGPHAEAKGYVEAGDSGVEAAGVFLMDADRAVSLYQVQGILGLINELPPPACKIYLYAILRIGRGSDTVRLPSRELQGLLCVKSHRPVKAALDALMEYSLIAPAERKSHYYINPFFVFNGDRLTYLQDYPGSVEVVYSQPADKPDQP